MRPPLKPLPSSPDAGVASLTPLASCARSWQGETASSSGRGGMRGLEILLLNEFSFG